MNSDNKSSLKENKMGVMQMFPLIVNISFPMMCSMLVQALYNIVDSIFVSRLGENALTAVSIAFPVQSLMLAFAIGTAVGTNALLSTRLGQGRKKEVSATAMNGLLLAFATTLLFILLGALFIRPYLTTQTNNQEIIGFTIDYLKVIMFGGFGCFGVVMSERLLQSTGKTVFSMLAQMAGAITNIILDPIMIFGLFGFPRLEMAGAALATVIGQFVGLGVSLFCNINFNKEIQFSLKGLKPDFAIIKQVYAVGVPTILQNSLMSCTTYLMNLILSTFSTTAMAIYGVYFKLNSFIFMPVFGLQNGLVPIIAYNYGAAKKDRVKSAIKIATLISLVLMTLGVVIFETVPDKLLLIFNASSDMLSIGNIALRIIATSFIFAAVGITFDSAFQALSAANYAAIHTIMRQIVMLLPAAFLLSKLGDINKVWFAFPIAETVSFVVALVFMARVLKRRLGKL